MARPAVSFRLSAIRSRFSASLLATIEAWSLVSLCFVHWSNPPFFAIFAVKSLPEPSIHDKKRARLVAVPGERGVERYIPDLELFSTVRLFWTLNAPNTWFARIPAISLSMLLITVPYRLMWPLSTMIRIGRAGSIAYLFSAEAP